MGHDGKVKHPHAKYISCSEKKNKFWSDKFLANLIRNKKYPTTATFFLPDQEQCSIS